MVKKRTEDKPNWNPGWTQVPRNGKQFLLTMWHPSRYSCYKSGDKSWMRIVILIPYWITSLCHVTGTHFVICQWCFLNKDKVCMHDWYVMRDVCNGLNQLCCRRYSDIHIIFIIRCVGLAQRNEIVEHITYDVGYNQSDMSSKLVEGNK
jgi:hypothetical protein